MRLGWVAQARRAGRSAGWIFVPSRNSAPRNIVPSPRPAVMLENGHGNNMVDVILPGSFLVVLMVLVLLLLEIPRVGLAVDHAAQGALELLLLPEIFVLADEAGRLALRVALLRG